MGTSILRDPRHLQIAVLSSLLVYGEAALGFDVPAARIVLILGLALLLQFAFERLAGRRAFEARSALISGLSLCLLLRSASPLIDALAVLLTISSKFCLRLRGKHVFNPTNFGIVLTVFFTSRAWVSPGQWGSSVVIGFLLACLGALVVHRALRSDVTFSFLGAYALLLVCRAQWLGDPMMIPLHQLESGSLVLFAFFMISDPKTTPDSRLGRVVFGVLVAVLAGYLQFARYRPVAVLPALLLLSPLVVLIDLVAPGPRFNWPGSASRADEAAKGVDHAPLVPARARVPSVLAPGGLPVLRLLRRQG